MDEIDILSNYDFDRYRYVKGLFEYGGLQQKHLRRIFQALKEDFAPDIAISITQNSSFEDVFSDTRLLFYEAGPLPRWDGRLNFYFDSGGHQTNSILATAFDRIMQLPIEDQTATAISVLYEQLNFTRNDFLERLEAFRAWAADVACGKKIALIANQPPESILCAGGYDHVDTDTFMMRVLNELPDGWIGIPTYHRDNQVSDAFETYLSEKFPNFVSLPSQWKSLGSDQFIPAVDGLVTIGSKAALSAALYGKPCVAYGTTMLAGFAGKSASDLATAICLTPAERGRVLCFLSNRYSFSYENCFEKEGALLSFFEGILKSKSSIDYQLDISNWRESDLIELYGAGD